MRKIQIWPSKPSSETFSHKSISLMGPTKEILPFSLILRRRHLIVA